MSDEKLFSLTAYRIALRAEVVSRYHALKGRGVIEEEARNIASGTCAANADIKPRPRAGVFRRELDAALAPRKPRVLDKTPYVSPWRLPE